MNSVKYLALLLVMSLLNACSTAPKKTENTITAESLIAQDFVNTMVQIDQLSPWSTVLQFSSIESGDLKLATQANRTVKNFGKALRVAAANSGYGLQTVDGVRGTNFVRFAVKEINDPTAGLAFTYDVSVGNVDFRRIYKPQQDGSVEPHKGMLVRGADVTEIRSDDSIFYRKPTLKPDTPLMADKGLAKPVQKQSDGFTSPLARRNVNAPVSAPMPEQEVALTSPAVATSEIMAPESSVVAKASVVEPATTNPAPVEGGYSLVRKRNLAESGMSNYESLLATKQDVAEEVLIFGDDSYVLGPRNKKLLGQVMGSFNPETDVVQVVGCSTGTTKIENGNAALAIGRANRVKEALLYSGIPHDKILDEGCWSPNANSTPFPNRGVVITVKRGVKKG